MATGLNREYTLERTEYVQEIRKKIIDKLSKDDMAITDPESANVLLSALRDYEKQELHKDKLAHDSEEADKDRAIAQDAIEIANELRRQRRNGVTTTPVETDPTIGIPDVGDVEIDETPDELAARDRKFQESGWSEFRTKMIKEGHDPRYTVDESGNIVPRKGNDEE